MLGSVLGENTSRNAPRVRRSVDRSMMAKTTFRGGASVSPCKGALEVQPGLTASAIGALLIRQRWFDHAPPRAAQRIETYGRHSKESAAYSVLEVLTAITPQLPNACQPSRFVM